MERSIIASPTNSQTKIHQLESEVHNLQSQIEEARRGHGTHQLDKLGLLPGPQDWGSPGKEFPHRRECEALCWKAQGEPVGDELLGKHLALDCMGCHGDTSKLKSGKFVKTNIDIKKQEQWPHVNVLRKYTKKAMFDNMDFEMFVAGETRVICNMKRGEDREGRLTLLCKLAYWLCKSKDWTLVRGLYEGIIESVELREADWSDDFGHYETMIPPAGWCQNMDNRRENEGVRPPKERKTEYYWCKAYQKNNCNDRSPHMAVLRQDEPPVPVMHMCAWYLQRDGQREDHLEAECPSKQ